MRNTTIFVQLASYRDPQLPLTISDLLQKAAFPGMLRFGICWQYDETENINLYDNNSLQFRIRKHHYSESQGLGWARNITNQLYDGEKLTLQLDSHHRFAPNWDVMMLEDYYAAKEFSAKPILSTYLTPFENGQTDYEKVPCLMSQYEFSPDKLLMSRPHYIQDYLTRTKPIRARTLSGHFFLTAGRFIQEVPYDPDIYFGGYTEETTMSARAFTRGWDFFSPYRQYIWHEYTRHGRPKHWEDHGTKSPTQKTSGERDVFARDKTRQLFEQEQHGIELGLYGLGTARTLQEYEYYGGFDFKKCRIQEYTLDVKEPPNPVENWEAGFTPTRRSVVCKWSRAFFSQLNFKKPKFLTLGIHDAHGNEIHRHDFTIEHEPQYVLLNNDTYVAEFKSDVTPFKLVMYMFDADKKWSPVYEKLL